MAFMEKERKEGQTKREYYKERFLQELVAVKMFPYSFQKALKIARLTSMFIIIITHKMIIIYFWLLGEVTGPYVSREEGEALATQLGAAHYFEIASFTYDGMALIYYYDNY